MLKFKFVFLLLCLLLFISCGPKESEITGEIFVATKGGQSFKLGAVSVLLLKKSTANGMREGKTQAKTSLSSLPDPQTVATTTTNSDGKFTFKVPYGEYAVLARAQRNVFDDTEHYVWLVDVSANQPNVPVSLDNNNITESY
jgi:hypothetical protein